MAQILVAEDDMMQQETIVDVFMIYGHTVITASNGAQAWQLYQQNLYDLAVVDMEMPVMNGLDLIKTIRQADADFPIIAITAYSHLYRPVDVLSLNVEAFLKKPLNISDLGQIVERIMTRRV